MCHPAFSKRFSLDADLCFFKETIYPRLFLNKSFFVYYIKQHLDIINNIDINENCRVKLIDQNINISNIDFTINEQYIVIEKDTYIIYKS